MRHALKMSINNNSKAYLACGVGLALLAGFAGYTAIDKVQDLVPVVVATQNIEPHTQVTDAMVKTIEVPALGRAENSVDDTSLVIGGYATSKIYANQVVIQPMVAKQFDDSGASGMALSIPDESLRAVTFPADSQQAVNGNVKRGDYVDIIATIDGQKMGSDTSITKTILQSVEVFDIGGEKPSIQNITLLLTLEQAEVVKHAYSVGEISFALNPGNSKTARTAGVIDKSFMERFGFRINKKTQ